MLREDIQSEQRLLQARAYNQDIPDGVVEGFHGGRAEEIEVHVSERDNSSCEVLARLLT